MRLGSGHEAAGSAALLALVVAHLGLAPAAVAARPRIDAKPPRVVLQEIPPAVLSATALTFRFVVRPSARGAPVECRLDRAAWKRCRSPKRVSGLHEGGHSFALRVGTAAARDSVTRVEWVVDTVAPAVPAIRTTGTEQPAVGSTAALQFSTDDRTALFSCKVDAAPFAPCTSPTAVVNTIGTHLFAVVARDAAMNTSRRASLTWRVDGVKPPPTTTPTPGPSPQPSPPAPPSPPPPTPDLTPPPVPVIGAATFDDSSANGSFAFTDSETGVTFVCSVDGAVASACASPFAALHLAPGPHSFAVRARDHAGNESTAAARSWITSATVAAVGDIACAPDDPSFAGGAGTATHCAQAATAGLTAAMPNLDAILLLGDLQYDCGTAAEFATVFGPSWGTPRLFPLEHPAPGNHDYGCGAFDASGYYGFFGPAAHDPAKGYYSYDVGAWHLIALNSNCDAVGGCGFGSPQESWLSADLAAHANQCTLAYWHHPRFSAGQAGDDPRTANFWNDLVHAHADLVLAGHDHTYQRFTPMDETGAASATGVRELIVGTGGEEHHPAPGARPTLEASDGTTFGVLKLILGPTGYTGSFLPAPATGGFTDRFTGSCS